MICGMPRVVSKKTAVRAAAPANRLRIIGGRWRGVPIDFPPIDAVRPSPDRVRETLFNWLQSHILGTRCLDLFAGSGALGVEALSRGAAHVTFVDRDPRIGRHLAETLRRLGAETGAVVTEDARRFLQRPPQPFDLVFLDPPYRSGLAGAALEGVLQGGWLGLEARVVLELAATEDLALPHGFTLQRERRYGSAKFLFLRPSA
jgi:16S rRNA (guanine966-N2)-methyltransferase